METVRGSSPRPDIGLISVECERVPDPVGKGLYFRVFPAEGFEEMSEPAVAVVSRSGLQGFGVFGEPVVLRIHAAGGCAPVQPLFQAGAQDDQPLARHLFVLEKTERGGFLHASVVLQLSRLGRLRVFIQQTRSGLEPTKLADDVARAMFVSDEASGYAQRPRQPFVSVTLKMEHQSPSRMLESPRNGSASLSRWICSSVRRVTMVSWSS